MQEYYYIIYKETCCEFQFENVVIDFGSKKFIDFIVKQNSEKNLEQPKKYQFETIHLGSFETKLKNQSQYFAQTLKENVFQVLEQDLKFDPEISEEDFDDWDNVIKVFLLYFTCNQKDYFYKVLSEQLNQLISNWKNAVDDDDNFSLLSDLWQSLDDTKI